MRTKLIEPRPIPLSLEEQHPDALTGYSMDEETMPGGEQMRLLLSWRAVLSDIGFSRVGTDQW
jgi:hypothetical protein